MADERISNEPIYEVLKGIQADLRSIRSDVDEMKTEMRIVRQHIAALVQSDMQRGTQIADLEQRLRRVEARLELRDA